MTEEKKDEGKKSKKGRKSLPRLKSLKSTGQQEESLGGGEGEFSLAGCFYTQGPPVCQTRPNGGC